MSRKLWGEIPPLKKQEHIIPNIMIDIERCMDKFCLAEYPEESDADVTENIV